MDDYNHAVAKALENAVITAADDMIRQEDEKVCSGPIPRYQHGRLARAVHSLRSFRKHRGLQTNEQETEKRKLDVSQGQYME